MSTELVGRRFGKYLVLARAAPTVTRIDRWSCRCDCGVEKVVHGPSLRRGQSKSCGCARSAKAIERNTTHGQSIGNKPTRAFSAWARMHARCSSPRHRNFTQYGARGIRVCERWGSFGNFFADMGAPPNKMTLERKNTNGNYEKSNCVWADRLTQANNTRRNVFLKVDGVVLTLAQFVRKHRLAYSLSSSHVRRGKRILGGIKFEVVTPYGENRP